MSRKPGTHALPSWEEMTACIFPHLTMEDEVMELELGTVAYIWWAASPYDQPQFDDGKMYWERSPQEARGLTTAT